MCLEHLEYSNFISSPKISPTFKRTFEINYALLIKDDVLLYFTGLESLLRLAIKLIFNLGKHFHTRKIRYDEADD